VQSDALTNITKKFYTDYKPENICSILLFVLDSWLMTELPSH